jgi:hypothetical protein
MKRIWLSLVLAVLASANLSPSWAQEKWEKVQGDCPAGIHHQPNGPFAVVLFCEEALGTYLAVVYIEPMGAPSTPNGKWGLNDRYWHDAEWGADVTGFRWSKDVTRLSVSTSSIYGSGGFFELDLQVRTAKQRLPKGPPVSISNPGPGYDISGSTLKETN